jgi:hypothetical protein
VEGQLTSLDVAADQQVMAGDAMAIQAQAYQRSPLEPLPPERISQRRSCFSSALTASAEAAPPADEQRSQVGRIRVRYASHSRRRFCGRCPAR